MDEEAVEQTVRDVILFELSLLDLTKHSLDPVNVANHICYNLFIDPDMSAVKWYTCIRDI